MNWCKAFKTLTEYCGRFLYEQTSIRQPLERLDAQVRRLFPTHFVDGLASRPARALAISLIPEGRPGTRISCTLPLTITTLDSVPLFSQPGVAILVDPEACAVLCAHPVEVGVVVRLEGPSKRVINARVVNCILLDNFWILGMTLDKTRVFGDSITGKIGSRSDAKWD